MTDNRDGILTVRLRRTLTTRELANPLREANGTEAPLPHACCMHCVENSTSRCA
jgi:hypothetical protein